MTDDDAYRLIKALFSSRAEGLALLEREPHLANARTGLGETPLHYLAVENHLEGVKLLVEHGAEVNLLNECGGSPLSDAASLCYVDLVAYLLAHGAKLNLAGQHEPTLQEPTRGGNAAIVSMIVAAGADINATNDMGETALHVTAESDERISALKVLLDAGANTNASGPFDETPLQVADACESVKAAEMLRQRRARRGKAAEKDRS
jgi:ankyrin repeat protein